MPEQSTGTGLLQFFPGSKPPERSSREHAGGTSGLHVNGRIPHREYLGRISLQQRGQWIRAGRVGLAGQSVMLPPHGFKPPSAEKTGYAFRRERMRFV